MKITKEADYALRVVHYLSTFEFGEKKEAKLIAESEGIPLRFLLKLLRKLNSAGITISYRGVNGGYALNRIPKEISFRDVIEAIDGPIYVNKCMEDAVHCNVNRVGRCAVHTALGDVQKNLRDQLDNINFENYKKEGLNPIL